MVDLPGLTRSVEDTPISTKQLPKPRPLCDEERAEPYPVGMLPPIVREAVEEVGSYVQAPTALIAASALAAVSTAVQAVYGVRRDAALCGPCGLFLLTVAESGERKSSVDKVFLGPLDQWQAKERQEHKRRLAQHKVDLAAWEDARADACDLVDHEMARPQESALRQIRRGDDTPEAISRHLAAYPVAAIISAEAGTIFGSHGMNAESVTRNLAQANLMWDGADFSRDRVGNGEVRVERPRVTMGLQVQPQVLDAFTQKTGGLAKGIGYFARFLFSRPESTQGSRYYKEPPDTQPALADFAARITTLLEIEPIFDEFGRLSSQYIRFDALAQRTWVGFHDEVEELLSSEQDYATIKDVASKAADNAARIACCLHIVEHGAHEPIGTRSIVAACDLMRWYLAEAVRFGRKSSLAPEMADAQLLEEWLVREVNKRHRADPNANLEISLNEVRRVGPNSLRKARTKKLENALEVLADHHRVLVLPRAGRKGTDILVRGEVIAEHSR